jgi:hypothetical protein
MEKDNTTLVLDPAYDVPEYRSSIKRVPSQALVIAPDRLFDMTLPLFHPSRFAPSDADLCHHHER